MTHYTTGRIIKDAEEDIYKDGCQPGTGGAFALDLEITAGTPARP